jgi:hypothetical protein
MKIQDMVFFAVCIFLVLFRKRRLALWFGLGSFVLAIPLFATWTFFTAERLIWYGAAFVGFYAIISLLSPL